MADNQKVAKLQTQVETSPGISGTILPDELSKEKEWSASLYNKVLELQDNLAVANARIAELEEQNANLQADKDSMWDTLWGHTAD